MADADSDTLMRAIVALLVDARELRPLEGGQRRTETILAEAGMSAVDIAELSGKQAAAVRMTLSRARRAKAKAGKRDG